MFPPTAQAILWSSAPLRQAEEAVRRVLGWGSDNREIFFSTPGELRAIDVTADKERLVAEMPSEICSLSVHPGGNRIAYHTETALWGLSVMRNVFDD